VKHFLIVIESSIKGGYSSTSQLVEVPDNTNAALYTAMLKNQEDKTHLITVYELPQATEALQ
jgi:hypothetical protein